MKPQTGHLIAAAVAGVVVGAFSTALFMANTMRRSTGSSVARAAQAVNADDVAAVLDADNPVAPHPAAPASAGAPSPSRPAGEAAPIDPTVPTLSAGRGDVVEDLRGRRLTLPVQGIDHSKLVQSFDDQRGSSRRHEAIDILAPRNTPVIAVEDGTVARLFSSRAGGITLYQYDPRQQFVYYYAHLERYADGLKEGERIRRGQVIGYVGTSGNAPPNTPHLHFAIFETTQPRRWWEGIAIDPFLVLR